MEFIGKPSGPNPRKLARRLATVAVVLAGGGAAEAYHRISASPAVAPSPSPVPAAASYAPSLPVSTPTPPVAPILRPRRIEAEQRLSDLGFWTETPDGEPDEASRHALIAFQKVTGLQRDGELRPEVLLALRNARRPTAVAGGVPHVEVDLKRQVLYFVAEGGHVERILPVSTGSGKLYTSKGRTSRAVTPTGVYRVTRKIAGWRVSDLGRLHYPSYFNGGIAFHGYPSVPVGPASHGCVRVPMFASIEVHRLLPVGTIVLVHDGSRERLPDLTA